MQGGRREMTTERPGFLVYYSIMDSLEEYPPEDKGVFLQAMCDYARTGVLPDFEDRGLRVLWRVAQTTLDRDALSYQDKCLRNRYNGYVSAQKRAYKTEHPGEGSPVEGRDFLSFDDWIIENDTANANDRQRSLATVNDREPITITIQSQYNNNNNSNSNNNNNSNTITTRRDVFADFAGDDAELLDALRSFEEMRKKIKKPLSDRAKELAVSKLQGFPCDQWVAILNQSVFNSWQGLFPLKSEKKTDNIFLEMLNEGV